MESVIRLRSFISSSGAEKDKIEQWLGKLDPVDEEVARAFVRLMAKVPNWKPPHYKPSLSGKRYSALGELRWKSSNKQFRIFGIFHEGSWVALVGCYHKHNVYTPSGAMDTAVERSKLVVEGAQTNEWYP